MLKHKTHFNAFQIIWGTIQTWSHSILLALKIPHSRSMGSRLQQGHADGPPELPHLLHPTHTHSELAICPGWINNWKGREVTLDRYWVNGIIVVSGGFLKITLTLLTAQVPSYCLKVGLTQLLQKVDKESDAPPGKGFMMKKHRVYVQGIAIHDIW